MVYPFLLSAIFTIMISIKSQEPTISYGFLIVSYILTAYGFCYFVKKKPFNQWLLFMGFVPVPLLPYLYEYHNPGWFQYIGTALAIIFYTIPCIVASLIIALTISLKNRKYPK